MTDFKTLTAFVNCLQRYSGNAPHFEKRPRMVARLVSAALVGVFIFSLSSPVSLAQSAPGSIGHSFSQRVDQIYSLTDIAMRDVWSRLPDGQSYPMSTEEWSSYSVFGGEMTSIAMDPSNSQVVYVGTRDAGVFKTTNAGASWQPARQGLSVYPIRSLKVDPQHPQVLYAGTDFDGVWKSNNAGANWFSASVGLDFSLIVLQIIFDPTNTQIIYLATAGGPGLMFGRIYKSFDGGGTWVQKDSGIPISYQAYVNGIRSLAIDPGHPLTLYAGTTQSGAFRSIDGGDTWTAINDGVPFASSGSTNYVKISALDVDPHHANRPGAIFSSGYQDLGGYYIFAGGHWQMISSTDSTQCSDGFTKNYLYFHPTDPLILYCAGAGFYKSTDGGVHWAGEIGPAYTHAREIAFHPSTPGVIYAAADFLSSTGGVFKSIDQGQTWQQSSQGITAVSISSVTIDPQNSNYIYAGNPRGYLYRTTDGGLTWQQGKIYYSSEITDLAVDPLNSQKIYLIASDIYTSTDQGVTFERFNGVRSAKVIAVTPHASGPIYVGTDFDGGIYKSTNGGLPWVQKNDGLPQSGSDIPTIFSLAVDPNITTRVWAGLGLMTNDSPGIVRSDNSGEHWYGMGLSRFIIETIAIHPADSNILLVGANYYGSGSYNIFKSTDGGVTWQLKASGIAPVMKIVYDPHDPCVVYAATDGGGVLRSISCGESWHSYNLGIFYPVLYSLAISSDTPPLLLTGSYGSGLYWTQSATRYILSLPVITK